LPLTVVSASPSLLDRDDRGVVSLRVLCQRRDDTEGSSPSGAHVARRELVFGRPRRSHHDAVMRIGGEAPRGGPTLNRGAKAIVQRRVAAASGRRLQVEHRRDARLQQLSIGYAAGRSSRPAGISPVVANRHNTMRSLRASATIIVLRAPPRASTVRLRYHVVRELPFWCTR